MPLLTPHVPHETLVPVGPWGRLEQQWRRISLSVQFLLAAAIVVSIAMLALGSWASERIQATATQGAAEAGAIFLQAFLQPYVQELPASGVLTPETTGRLNGIMEDNDSLDRFVLLKIWRLDATLAYSSKQNIPPNESVQDEIQFAAQGNLARHFEELSEALIGVAPEDDLIMLEVYAPLYKRGTNEVVAVGEFYQNATTLIARSNETRVWSWLVVAAITVSMLLVLFLIVERGSRTIASQRLHLKNQFEAATELSNQNKKLRKIAEQAQVDATEANENFLSRIGSDLHDGPIQTLSLLMLSLQYGRDGEMIPDAIEDLLGAPEKLSTIKLAKSLYAELRGMSSGLILPGIQSADLDETLQLAAKRHEGLTGAQVQYSSKNLPRSVLPAVKICCYRVVQEGLNNGFHHGGGAGQAVDVTANKRKLTIVVSDSGPGFSVTAKTLRGRSRLGLIGIQNRVKALKGKVRLNSTPGKGTRLVVTLPLDPVAD